MKKLLIAATLTATALGATPLLAQQAMEKKPGHTAATEACPAAGKHGNRDEHHAQMRNRMQEMHARVGTHEGWGRHSRRSGQAEHSH